MNWPFFIASRFLSLSLSSLPQQSLSYLSIFYHCLVERHSGGGNHLDGIQLFGPRSDVSGSIMSNRFSGNKRSNSDSHFTTQEHPETLHWSKVTKKNRIYINFTIMFAAT